MNIDLSEKIVLLTGASRGIGAALAKGLVAKGAHVILLARTIGALEALDDEIKQTGVENKTTLMPFDLLKIKDIPSIAPAIEQKFGRLDILIGNAGILGPLSPFNHISEKELSKVMDTNFYANIELIKALDPLIRNAPEGRMVFSYMAQNDNQNCYHEENYNNDNTAYWGAYSTSKEALRNAVLTYASETKKTNMKVNLINPGFVQSSLLDDAFPGGYSGQLRQPQDVVNDYLELCATNCESHGKVIKAIR